MKIRKITLYRYNKPFRFKFTSTQTPRARAESVVVLLEFEYGIRGYGESAPRTYVTGEDCSAVAHTIQDCFSPTLFSLDIRTVKDIENALDQLEQECIKKNVFNYNSALGAVDIALFDALGSAQRVSVTSFLGSIVTKKPSCSISVPLLPLRKIQDLFIQLPQLKGIKHLKVLVGDVEVENIERLRLVRSLFGKDPDIRLENNGKWTFQQAISNLQNLEQFNIAAVEQPLAKENIEGLRMLRKAIDIPVIVDESMCSLSDATMLAEREACDMFNIKISKCGGLLRSKRIAGFAESRNIPCQLGAHVGETEILREAGKAFASTTSHIDHLDGYSFLLFKDSWSDNPFAVKEEETAHENFGLGLGSANQQAIIKHCSPVIELID